MNLLKFPELAPTGANSDILSFQPTPIRTQVITIDTGFEFRSVVVRHWKRGESAKCRLCSTCTAYRDSCTLVAYGDVPKDEAPLMRTRVRPASTPKAIDF